MPRPPRKRGRFNVFETLYDEYVAGRNVDTTIMVGKEKLNVHRNALVGVSKEFKKKLKKQRGDGGRGDRNLITLPEGTSLAAAKGFIKVLYLKDASLDIGVVMEVVYLCDKYLVEQRLDEVISTVMKTIHVDNCLAVCEGSVHLSRCQRLFDAAWKCFIRNFDELLEEFGTKLSSKLWEKILHLEGEDVEISEIFLFEELLKWRDSCESRQEEFQRLLALVRFPIMDLEEIMHVVEPAGVLSDKDLMDISAYIVGGGPKGKRIPRFVTHSRKYKFVTGVADLQLTLDKAEPYDLIKLGPGIFRTYSNLVIPEKVTIKGAGPSTVIAGGYPDFNVESLDEGPNDVHISNLQIVLSSCNQQERGGVTYPINSGLSLWGARNIAKNITFQECALIVGGRNCKIDEVTCNGGPVGICVMHKGYNTLSNLMFRNLAFGLYVSDDSDGNIIDTVSCHNVDIGVTLETNSNYLANFIYNFSRFGVREDRKGVQVLGGCWNRLTNLKCRGYQALLVGGNKGPAEPLDMEDVFAMVIESQGTPEPVYNQVDGCAGGPVKLCGENNTLKNVDAGNLFVISGGGHKLGNCLAEKYFESDDSTDVDMTDCDLSL